MKIYFRSTKQVLKLDEFASDVSNDVNEPRHPECIDQLESLPLDVKNSIILILEIACPGFAVRYALLQFKHNM